MSNSSLVKASKFMSLILRHRPETIGIALDAEGWVPVAELVARSNGKLDSALVAEVVRTSDKQRFALSEDGLNIRANQGHSVDVDLGLAPMKPPDVLYHGTADRFLHSIRQKGLVSRSRRHVHLSSDPETATAVGARHGNPVVLLVEARRMHMAENAFYLSKNGVWLTDHVPPEFLQF